MYSPLCNSTLEWLSMKRFMLLLYGEKSNINILQNFSVFKGYKGE